MSEMTFDHHDPTDSTTTRTRTALVTGATSGIGRATAQALADAGLHVVLHGRDEARGEAAVKEIRTGGGRADFVALELHDAASARALAAQALDLLDGRIDVLVNNVGAGSFAPTEATTEAAFDAAYDLNVKVPFFLTAAIAPGMAERGDGVVVNVSTMVAEFGFAGMSVYGSAKAAVNLLTKAWAAEYGPRGVRVNAVSPGPTRTEGTLGMGDGLDAMASAAPSGRPGTAQEIAGAIAYLASPVAAFVQGVVLPVDGGRVAV